MSLMQLLQNYPRHYLTDSELACLLPGTQNSRYSSVKRMLAKGTLVHIRRGLYYVPKNSYCKKIHPFELAQYIYGPSFVSLESALSYHRLIPEAVYTITNAAGKRTKEFKTPLGIFSYTQVPLENLYTEVLLLKENEFKFYIAKPWRAICDYIYCYRQNWNSLKPLVQSLRINLENLPPLRNEEIQLFEEYYHQNRISKFLNGVQKELATFYEPSMR